MVSFTTLLAFAAGALASPVAQDAPAPVVQNDPIPIPSNWTWHVSHSEMGCTRGGCYYHINITVPDVDTTVGHIAGVTAQCDGVENGYYKKGNWFANCTTIYGVNNGVAAKFGERDPNDDDRIQDIIFSFRWNGYEDRPAYNFTGSHKAVFNAFVSPPLVYDVKPTEVFIPA